MDCVRAAYRASRKSADGSRGASAQIAKRQVQENKHKIQATHESPKVRVLCSNREASDDGDQFHPPHATYRIQWRAAGSLPSTPGV